MTFEPLSDWDIFTEDYEETFTIKGHRFRYHLGKYLKELYAGASEERVRRLVNEAIANKYKDCKWDREHHLFLEPELRQGLLLIFNDYLQWLNRKAATRENS
jgi:hypothetical protein